MTILSDNIWEINLFIYTRIDYVKSILLIKHNFLTRLWFCGIIYFSQIFPPSILLYRTIPTLAHT